MCRLADRRMRLSVDEPHAARLQRRMRRWQNYLTVSVPYIPAARWPGAWQKYV